MRSRAYAAHMRFIAPARARSDPYLLVIGILVVELAFIASPHLIGPFLMLVPLADPADVMLGTTPWGLILQLCSFAILALAVVLVCRRLHNRGLASLIGPVPLAMRQWLAVTLLLAVVVLVLEFVPPDAAKMAQTQMRPLLPWLAVLPMALLALLIQTGAEELFYRGYIQQQLAARYRQRWVWMVLPSVLFAFAHYSPDAPQAEALQYLIWSFFFGLAAADLTARSGTLGPAIGFHLVNNALAFLLYGEVNAPDSGLALFLFPPDLPGDMTLPPPYHPQPLPFDPRDVLNMPFVMELVGIAILWTGARLALRR